MTESQKLLHFQPLVGYEREMEVGKTYIVTIDLRWPPEDQALENGVDGSGSAHGGANIHVQANNLSGDKHGIEIENIDPTDPIDDPLVVEGWNFLDEGDPNQKRIIEEYPIKVMLDTAPFMRYLPTGDATLVVHRFGGTYGPVSFRVWAEETTVLRKDKSIDVILLSRFGVPIYSFALEGITIRPAMYQTPWQRIEEALRLLDEDNFRRGWDLLNEVLVEMKAEYENVSRNALDHSCASIRRLIWFATICYNQVDLKSAQRWNWYEAVRLVDKAAFGQAAMLFEQHPLNHQIANWLYAETRLRQAIEILLDPSRDIDPVQIANQERRHSNRLEHALNEFPDLQDLLDTYKKALRSRPVLLEQMLIDLLTLQEEIRQEIRNLKETDEMSGRALRELQKQRQAKIDRLEPVELLIEVVQNVRQAEANKRDDDLLSLATHEALSYADPDPRVQVALQTINNIIEQVRERLDADVAQAHDLDIQGNRNQGIEVLKGVLQRYRAYPAALKMLQDWVKASLDADEAHLAALSEEVRQLEERFWGNDPEGWQYASQQARTMDRNLISDSPELAAAQVAKDLLDEHSSPDENGLQHLAARLAAAVRARWLLRLAVAFYCDDGGLLADELVLAQEQGHLDEAAIKPLKNRRSMLNSMFDAMLLRDKGLYPDAIERIEQAHQEFPSERAKILRTNINSEWRDYGKTIDWIRECEQIFTHSSLDQKNLKTAWDILREIDEIAAKEYFYIQKQLGADIDRIWEHYYQEWERFALKKEEQWRAAYVKAERAQLRSERVMQLEQLANDLQAVLDICPLHHQSQQQSILLGRMMLSRAAAYLHKSFPLKARALLEEARQYLPENHDLVMLERIVSRNENDSKVLYRNAENAASDKKLTESRKYITEARERNCEDDEINALANRVDQEIAEIQNLAVAAAQERDLKKAIDLWDKVCSLHKDGSYLEINGTERSFKSFLDQAKKSRDMANQQINEITAAFRQFCIWLAGQRSFNEQYDRTRQQFAEQIATLPPGITIDPVLQEALDKLDVYARTNRALQELMDQRPEIRTSIVVWKDQCNKLYSDLVRVYESTPDEFLDPSEVLKGLHRQITELKRFRVDRFS